MMNSAQHTTPHKFKGSKQWDLEIVDEKFAVGKRVWKTYDLIISVLEKN